MSTPLRGHIIGLTWMRDELTGTKYGLFDPDFRMPGICHTHPQLKRWNKTVDQLNIK